MSQRRLNTRDCRRFLALYDWVMLVDVRGACGGALDDNIAQAHLQQRGK